MKLFILTLAAICVGLSESDNGNSGGYPSEPVKALQAFYNIQPKDMSKCKVADEEIRMNNVRYNLGAMAKANANQQPMKDDITRQLSFNVIAAAMTCWTPDDVNKRVDEFMKGGKPGGQSGGHDGGHNGGKH